MTVKRRTGYILATYEYVNDILLRSDMNSTVVGQQDQVLLVMYCIFSDLLHRSPAFP